jgi:Putative Ig domain
MTFQLKSRRLWTAAAAALLVNGCLGGGSSSGDGGRPPPSGNHAPTISGTPGTEIRANEAYEFQPSASDPDGDDLVFSISNQPAWATFDTATGRLHGTPASADVGYFEDIAIAVFDGDASASLDAFSISVEQVSEGSITLSWTPPTTNSDGSAITGLAGYRIYYGRASDELSEIVVIDNPGTSRWVIDDLSPATWHFAMTSYNDVGLESVRIAVGSKTTT